MVAVGGGGGGHNPPKRNKYDTFFRNACLVGLEAIYRDGLPAGYVRRADYGFYIDKPIAYG